jgi:pentatricopeptide repeat protein
VLTAFAHSGLVKDGIEVKYKVTPEHERYNCVIDMLCRVGRAHEALELIHEMPMKLMVSVWGAFIAQIFFFCK